MRRLFTNIESLLKWCFSAGVAVAAFVLFMMTLLVTGDVIGREFGHSTGVAHEISGYCLVVIVFLGLAYTLRVGKHVEVSVVTAKLPQRARRWLKIATSFVSMAFIVWLLWFTLQHAIRSYALKSVSMTPLRVPLWPLEMLLPIGLGLLTLAIMVETIKIIKHNQG